MEIQKTLERSLPQNSIRALNEEEGNRRFELSFSSEEPYTRYFGVEILDHEESSINLKRLREIGVVLFNHDRDKVIGKIIGVSIKDRRGCAEIEFDNDDFSEKIMEKVKSGTLKGVSVGYSVDTWEKVEKGKKSSDGKYTGECFIAKKWTPFEVSIVSVPADATVGVGRDYEPIPAGKAGTGGVAATAERQLLYNKNILERSNLA